MSNNVHILTREVNDHNQQGEYFMDVFAKPPTIIQLAEALKGEGISENIMDAVALLEHIRLGGGRRRTEDVWYYLRQRPLK